MIVPEKITDAHDDSRTALPAHAIPRRQQPGQVHHLSQRWREIGLKDDQGAAIAKKKNVAFHQKLIGDDCVARHSDHKGVQAFRPSVSSHAAAAGLPGTMRQLSQDQGAPCT